MFVLPLLVVALHLYARAMRILVTGGAGFIGSHLVEKLLALGHDVSILDDFNDFYDPQIKRDEHRGRGGPNSAFIKSICATATRCARFFTAKNSTPSRISPRGRACGHRSITRSFYYDTNVSGTLHLLEAARATGIERFIFASSSSVYGISKEVPFSEEMRITQTISPYAASKVAGRISLLDLLASLPDARRRVAIFSLFMGRASGPISRSINSRKKSTRANRSISSAMARRGAITPTSTTSSRA